MITTIHQHFYNGRSGSEVCLATIDGQLGVLKKNINQIADIIHKHSALPFDKPQLFWTSESDIFMQYIPGVSIKQYLEAATVTDLNRLVTFIADYFNFCIQHSVTKNYQTLLQSKTQQYTRFLPSGVDFKFDTVLPSSITHGDFTFDNILYYDNRFYMIDIHSTPFDSVAFDANKLRQDLTGLWFVRNESNKVNWQLSCNYIYKQLEKMFPELFNDEIYKLMIARILPYCVVPDETEYLTREIKRLCK